MKKLLIISICLSFPLFVSAQASGGQIKRNTKSNNKVSNVRHNSSPRRTKENVVNVPRYKFAFYDFQKLANNTPEWQKIIANVKAKRQEIDTNLKMMQDELTRKTNEYENKKKKMKKAECRVTEHELQIMNQKIHKAYEDANKEMSKLGEESLNYINAYINNATYSYKNKYKLDELFDNTIILCFNQNVCTDITNYLISELQGNIGLIPNFKDSSPSGRIGYLFLSQILGKDYNENSDFHRSEKQRVYNIAKIIANEMNLDCVVDATQMYELQQKSYAINITDNVLQRFK